MERLPYSKSRLFPVNYDVGRCVKYRVPDPVNHMAAMWYTGVLRSSFA